MAIKFLSGLNLSNVTAGSILKLDSNGNIVAAVDGTDYNTGSADSWSATGSDIYRNSDVRIGTYQSGVSPSARLHVFDYQTTDPKLLIEDGNTGDASMQFKISTQQYTMGIDNSDSDKFIIANAGGFNLAANTHALEISTAGKVTIPAHTSSGTVKFEMGGYNRLRFNGGIDLLGYSSDHLWVIGNSTTNTINLGADWDWDKQVAISYTPNTVGGAGGVMILGQTEKNNANWTHGTTKLYTNGTERLRIDSNGNVKVYGGNLDLRDPNEEQATNVLYFNANNGNSANTSNDIGTGIVWKPDYTGYSKRSAGIMQIGEGNYFKSGLAFYTNNTSNNSTDWSERMRLDMDGNLGIGTSEPSYKLHVEGNVGITEYLQHKGDNNTYLRFSTDLIRLAAGGVEMIRLLEDATQDAVVINEGGADVDFRVESNTDTHAFFVQGSDGNVGIGTDSPNAKLEVRSDGSAAGGAEIRLQHANNNSTDVVSTLNFANNVGSVAMIQSGTTGASNTGYISFFTDNAGTSSEKMRILGNGNVGIGTTSPSQKLHVAGNIQLTDKANSILFGSSGVDGTWSAPKITRIGTKIIVSDYSGVQFGGFDGSAYGARMTVLGTGNVGIGTTSPGGKLHLEGNFESGKALVIKGTYGTDTEYYFRTHGTNSEYLALYAAGTRVMNFNSGIVDTYKGLRLFGGAISTGASNHLVIGSSVQIGQGDEDPVIEFKYGTTSLGKIDQFGDIHAGGFKVSGTTGFLKSDGSVDTSTYVASSALSSYLPLTGGTMTGDLVIDSGSTGSTTQVYSAFDTLTFNNLHNSVAAGPNKIIMYDDGAWKGGFGIHSSTVAYYSGDTHKWYKTASGPGGPTFTERMTLDGSGNLSVDGTLTAGGTITGTGGSFTDTITSTKNGTALVMDGGSSAEGVRMKADSSTTYPVFLRTLNPSGGGETSAWLFKEANTAWGIWHNNPSNTIDFTRSPATGIANDVGGGDNTVMIRLDMQYGHGRFAGDVYSSNLTISDGIYHEGDTNTSITFGTDTINFNTGGGTRATINDSGAKFNNNVIVGGGSTLSLGQAGEEDDNGRTVLIEGVANGSNGEGSGRIFFSENNNTATNLYGLSLYYEGDGNAQLPSGFQPNTGNATWSLRQHNNSLNGSAIISGSRGNNNVTFGGNLYVPNVIYHTGDTNTYMQFHAGDQWRVVTGGSERLEVNNTYTTVANDFWAEDKSHAGNQNWKTKTYVRDVGVEGGSIADKWVHLTTVDIDAAYDKAALKFKIHGFDDVSCGTENIDVLYENGGSVQETHRLDWYSTDGTANLFKAVKSTHSGSNLAHSYELWVQMAGDWRDTFTVEVETWTDEAGFITYSEAVGQATAPSGDSNDQSKTSREWYTKNTTIYADGTALQTQSQADNRYLQLTGGTVSGAVTLGAQLTLSSFGTGVLRVDAGSVSVDTSNYLTSMPANSTVTSVTFGGVKVEEALDRPGLLEINRDGTDTWSGIMTKFSGTAEWALMGNETSFGLYDDQQNEWAWRYVENSYFEAYNDGSVKLQTASNGVKILNVLELGNLGDTNGGVLKLNGTTANKQAVIKCTNGNLHIDSEDGNALYLNYYEGTSDNIIFGNGNGGASGAKVTSSGVVHATSVEVAGNLSVRNITARDIVSAADRTYALGTDANRWAVVFCETLDSAGQHESNLQDKEQPISHYETGTVLSWKDGKNRPCTQYADHMRMGIAVHGQDSPLIQGAEPVLCTGVVEEGDYLVTSDKEGHAVAVPRNIVKEQMLFDCVIGKALENGDGESHLVKTWINI